MGFHLSPPVLKGTLHTSKILLIEELSLNMKSRKTSRCQTSLMTTHVLVAIMSCQPARVLLQLILHAESSSKIVNQNDDALTSCRGKISCRGFRRMGCLNKIFQVLLSLF